MQTKPIAPQHSFPLPCNTCVPSLHDSPWWHQVYWGYKITFTGQRPKVAPPKDMPLVDRSKLVLDLEAACFLVKAVVGLRGKYVNVHVNELRLGFSTLPGIQEVY